VEETEKGVNNIVRRLIARFAIIVNCLL